MVQVAQLVPKKAEKPKKKKKKGEGDLEERTIIDPAEVEVSFLLLRPKFI